MTDHLDDARIQDALDGRLGPEALADAREHVRSCGSCAERWQAYESLKRVATRLAQVAVPGPLAEAVRAALDAADARERGASRWRRRLAGAAVAAGIVTVGIAAWLATRSRDAASPPTLPRQAAQDFRAFRSGQTALDLETDDPAALERHLAGQGLGFPVRVFDLAMMQQRLLGGGVGEVAGRPSALFAYRGADGALVVCQMYAGTLAGLPAPRERREHEGIPFQVYREGELTVVFWPEGEVVCVLVGDGPPEAIVALALAKAMKAAA